MIRQVVMSEIEYQELWRLAELPLATVKALWDQYDGCNSPGGFAGETIHATLNLRGHGDYCAV